MDFDVRDFLDGEIKRCLSFFNNPNIDRSRFAGDCLSAARKIFSESVRPTHPDMLYCLIQSAELDVPEKPRFATGGRDPNQPKKDKTKTLTATPAAK